METYWPEGTLADLLDIHVQNYETDFREYWQLDADTCPEGISAEDWSLARLLDKVGSKMLASAQLLRVHPEIAEVLRTNRPWESPEDAIAELVQYDVAQARSRIELASQCVGRLFQGKTRLSHVLVLLSGFRLSDRAAAFADRMVQCYVWGFDTETTIMARAVIEAALEERISQTQLASLGFRPGPYGYTYAQYRTAAERLGIVDADRAKELDEIRQAGNEAVHAAPGLHPNPLVTMIFTVLCLRSLFPVSDSPE